MASARRPKKRGASGVEIRSISGAQIRKTLARQKLQAAREREEARARASVKSFKVKAADKGKLVFVGIKGKRNPQNKGRKGYLVHVTKTGKKRLLRQSKQEHPFKPQKINNLQIPFRKAFRKVSKEFNLARLEKTKSGGVVVKGSGELVTGGAHDFSGKVVTKIAKSVQKTISGQRSHRSFMVRGMVRVQRSDGTEKVYEVNVGIDRADHVAIEVGGIENFIRQKFYANMARELQYDGYVTAGSSNHIRSLSVNAGLEPDEWTNKDGTAWRGREAETATIQEIQWEILQAK